MKSTMRTLFPILAALTLMLSCTRSSEEMNFKLGNDGKVTVTFAGKPYIENSNIALVLMNGTLREPIAARQKGKEITVSFDGCEVVLEMKSHENGSVRLEVTSVPDEVDAFIFGPFVSPGAVETGEYIGAAWQDDGSAVCIQSLNPKTQGEFFLYEKGRAVHQQNSRQSGNSEICFENNPDFTLPSGLSAGISDGKTVLSCAAMNYTRPHTILNSPTGMKNLVAEAIPAPDGSIKGAAIALLCAADASDLLEQIGRLEIEEGLPHPTINGEWAKTSPHATDLYLIFSSGDSDAQIRMAERAGVHWIYFSDPFKSWGHFDINTSLYPGGLGQFKDVISEAKKHDINIGFHTLSNFIHTYDPYITPIPHKNLLAFDPTVITEAVSAEDSVIHLAEALNYSVRQNLSSVRLGDEIITFDGFDPDKSILTGCRRGAFGTTAAAHSTGDTITHLADHGYMTFFPSATLQGEMAGNIGRLIAESGIRRMSFDGLEGCKYTGHGSYGESAYVQKVFEACGNDLICDASTISHFRWHAHSYFNWGEPWYDYQRRGGGYNYRVKNQDIFNRNLMPNMLGWYVICPSKGRFEPTMPESVEYMLSHTVAHKAGLCFVVEIGEGDLLNSYLDMIKLWQDFKFSVDVPEEIRERMKDERTEWHLEKKDGLWILSEMFIQDYDMGYCDNSVITESGTTGYTSTEASLKQSSHRSNIILDCSTQEKGVRGIIEPFHCRIRVGTPQDKGKLQNLTFSGGWFGSPILSFPITAYAGEYLEYNGGKTLYRYDRDMNLLETVVGEGEELLVDGDSLSGYTLDYNLGGDDDENTMILMLKYIRTRKVFTFPTE